MLPCSRGHNAGALTGQVYTGEITEAKDFTLASQQVYAGFDAHFVKEYIAGFNNSLGQIHTIAMAAALGIVVSSGALNPFHKEIAGVLDFVIDIYSIVV